MDRRQETKIVKAALEKAGYKGCRIKHQTGTAWGWIRIGTTIDHHPSCTCTKHSYGVQETCEACRRKYETINNHILAVVMTATGRHGEYDGRVSVNLDFDQAQYDKLPVVD